jgi:SAM-dependent methyltransferase
VEPAAEPIVDGEGCQEGEAAVHGGVVGHLRHRLGASVRALVVASRPEVTVGRHDLPEWVRASDVLADGADADQAKAFARGLGLPRVGDSVAAWAALGALAAIVRVRDDGRRSAVIVDESGGRSPLSRWARAIGFAPVELELTGRRSSVEVLDVDTASLDVIVRLHPGGCDADDIDEAMSQASWALKSGGLLCVTLPIGGSRAEGALGPADVRGVLARAHDLGFVLVGDLDGDITGRMRQASGTSTRPDAAYGLLRLTLRRR